MDVQILKAMNLVVHLGVAAVVVGVSIAVLVHKLCHRVLRNVSGIRCLVPCRIAELVV